MKAVLSFVFAFLSVISLAQKNGIQSGPMLGYNDMREVMIWVQTEDPADVSISYWSIDDPEKKGESNRVKTDRSNACVAHLSCSSLDPGTEYAYSINLNGTPIPSNEEYIFETQPLWQWRTEAPDFKVVAASCAYINEEAYDRPGTPYGGDYQIFESIADKNPNMMVWLGDNVYLREADWGTRNGILHRYTHTRSCPEMQSLLSKCHHYAILDDHDFGPNDASSAFINKGLTQEAFELFWANPSYGLSENGGTTSQFRYMDVDFFLLDNRSFRTESGIKGMKETILGKEQKKWLIQALDASTSFFKVVAIGGQFLNDVPVYENYAVYQNERDELIQLIDDNKIKGVIFLSGDRHHTELSAMKMKNGNTIYDLTSSPLTSTAYDHSKEENNFRVEGTHVGHRNFSTLSFSGPTDNREVLIEVFDSNGELVWDKKLGKEDF